MKKKYEFNIFTFFACCLERVRCTEPRSFDVNRQNVERCAVFSRPLLLVRSLFSLHPIETDFTVARNYTFEWLLMAFEVSSR